MLTIAQIIVSVVLIVLILLQERSAGLGSALGGMGGTPYQARRGLEKAIFWGTVIFAFLFAGLAILNFIIN